MYEDVIKEAIGRLFGRASPRPGDLLVLGGSTSAVHGERIGKGGDPLTARSILLPLLRGLAPTGVILAVQGCEHTNRSLVLPRSAAAHWGFTQTTLVPVPSAGGSLAAVYYFLLDNPAVVASLDSSARYGLDIGGVLIGMHLRPVAVPVPLSDLHIGHANISGGYSRPPLIGGERAVYDDGVARKLLQSIFRRDG